MDIKEYISSGVIERYVLGASTEQEQQEVACMAKIYPEIKEAVREQEEIIEKLAERLAKQPPESVKNSVMEQIQIVPQESGTAEKKSSEKGRFVEMKAIERKSNKSIRWIAAASLFIIVSLGYFFFELNRENTSLEGKLVALNAKQQQALDSVKTLSISHEDAKRALERERELAQLLAMDNTRRVDLRGTKVSPTSRVEVFWNSSTGKVAMNVNDLPEPGKDKQYQLWAIVDGTPTDLGVFDYDTSLVSPQLMPYDVEGAGAFAITLEPMGGSKEPTLSSMVVLGEVV